MYHETHFTADKIAQLIKLIESLVYRDKKALPPFRYKLYTNPGETPLTGPDIDDKSWETIEPESYWGAWLSDFTLRSSFSVPANWDAKEKAALYLPLGEAGDFSHPEAFVYIDGVPYAACDRHHQEIILPGKWRYGLIHSLALHGWTGLGGDFQQSTEKTQLFMRKCYVVLIDSPTRDFIASARVALGTTECLDKNHPARFHLLNALDEAFTVLDMREPFGERFYKSITPAHETLKRGIERAGSSLDAEIAAAGHSHIDVAWLWTLGQTRQKVGRTFQNVLRHMEQFPDYHFTQSQPQLYDYMRQDFPALFEKVRKRVEEGRWEIIGGMWVEADCNLSGPESLARQFLLGRSFFREHFGTEAESPVLWLPDVFGYAWNLPQLIKQAGLDYFFTIKISWNQYNRLPYDTFWWQGLDGTRVLTHFSTSPESPEHLTSEYMTTYNSKATPAQVLGTWNHFQQKELGTELLMAYGYGDGGGGPTREMLENIREMKDFPGLPRMSQKKVGDFFRKVETDAGSKLPVWNGELYFELHRGTYTSQSRNKRANRKSEFMLHDAEFLAVMASIKDSGFRYPAEELRKAWELVCLNQFHDIIPGSSINPVYRESLDQYREVARKAKAVRDRATDCIFGTVNGDLLVINPTSFTSKSLAFSQEYVLQDKSLADRNGNPVHMQRSDEGIVIDAGEVPPYSALQLFFSDSIPPEKQNSLTAESNLLENDFVRIELNSEGDITRIYDKVNVREVLPDGAVVGQFQAFGDRPLQWDAWDVFIYYESTMWLAEPATSIKVVECGPLRASIEIRRRILQSSYTQRISLDYNSPRIDFDTSIDWRERHVLLKAAFPVDILSPTATSEIQWGNVERTTHRNTSWDWARFETCAQKWVDLSEGGYGVSLLNDCKYGHDIRDNVIRISLLRSPTNPDPEADQGEHRFAYSLLPHTGRWDEETVREAYLLNDPLITVVRGRNGVAAVQETNISESLLSVDRPNVVIETVKAAEDRNGIIVRMYECMRCRGRVMLTMGFAIQSARRTNLIEDDGEELEIVGNKVSLMMKPFEIVSLRIVPA